MALDVTDGGHHTSSTTVLFGATVMLVGVFLTLQTNHLLPPDFLKKFWPLGIVAAGLIFVLRGMLDRNSGVHRRLPWGLLIFVVIVGSVAAKATGGPSNVRATDSTDQLTISAAFGQSQVVSQSTSFKRADITSIMGGAQLDLRQATIAPGAEAVVDVDVLMGGVVLRVPETWLIESGTTTIFGGISDQRGKSSTTVTGDSVPPKLKVRGSILMGGLVIRK